MQMTDKTISTIVSPPFRTVIDALLVLTVSLLALPATAQDGNSHHDGSTNSPAPAFVASSAKPFPALMNDAMAVMAHGMQRAPMNGVAEHDFITMMIPHHQGAIDMAKAVLLHTKDRELQNLAQGIITEQQNEIQVMQAWLQRHQAQQPSAGRTMK
jgi:uncharacterized protein (DUF305 family)